jgi:GT2 family glycosyltransferase
VTDRFDSAPLDATVLICSRGRPALLLDAVESVLAGARVPAELLVVDQSDEPDERLARTGTVRGCLVRYVHSSTPGLSRARNLGLRSAVHEMVVMLDDDVLVEPDWLAQLLDGFVTGGRVAVATGRVLAAPTEGGGRVPPAALVTLADPATFRGRQWSDVMPGANVAVDRDVVLALGGYDERLGPGTRFGAAEDNDLGFRLLEAGFEIRHVPEAVVLHRAWRSRGNRLRLRWHYGRGKGAFYAKHLSLVDRFILQRLTRELGRRSRRIVVAVPRSPATVIGEAVSIGGTLSGGVAWMLRERVPASRLLQALRRS